MVNRLITEMNLALDNDLFLSALAIALMLPDICGKAAYPNDLEKSRYTKWYSEYIGQYEKSPFVKESKFPYLSANVVYDLRCSFLHSGNPNLEKNKEIDQFDLIAERKNQFDIYGDSCSILHLDIETGKFDKRIYEMNIRRFCLIVSSTAKNYYEDNKDKFDFFNYSIIEK